MYMYIHYSINATYVQTILTLGHFILKVTRVDLNCITYVCHGSADTSQRETKTMRIKDFNSYYSVPQSIDRQ
jgi:hypothetical protein